jgi:hypothetical protein
MGGSDDEKRIAAKLARSLPALWWNTAGATSALFQHPEIRALPAPCDHALPEKPALPESTQGSKRFR